MKKKKTIILSLLIFIFIFYCSVSPAIAQVSGLRNTQQTVSQPVRTNN